MPTPSQRFSAADKTARARLAIANRLGVGLDHPSVTAELAAVTSDPKWQSVDMTASTIPLTTGQALVPPAVKDGNGSAKASPVSGIASGRGNSANKPAAKPADAPDINFLKPGWQSGSVAAAAPIVSASKPQNVRKQSPSQAFQFFPAGGEKTPNIPQGTATITHRDGTVTVNRWDGDGKLVKHAFNSEAEANAAEWNDKGEPTTVNLPKGGDAFEDVAGRPAGYAKKDVPATVSDETEPVDNTTEEEVEPGAPANMGSLVKPKVKARARK